MHPATMTYLEANERQAEEDRAAGKALRQALSAISLRTTDAALEIRPAPEHATLYGERYRASVISLADGAMLFGSYARTPREALHRLTEAMNTPRETEPTR